MELEKSALRKLAQPKVAPTLSCQVDLVLRQAALASSWLDQAADLIRPLLARLRQQLSSEKSLANSPKTSSVSS